MTRSTDELTKPSGIDASSRAAAALRAMRPHQWVKNLLVFVPVLTSRSFTDWPSVAGALVMFAGFCAAASSIYLINDFMDLEADRNHPRKRNRPFASGALPVPIGMALAAVLFAASLALTLPFGTAYLIVTYVAVSVAYSVALKQFPLVDVFILAALYTLRIVAGGVASNHPVTLWLLAFSGFTFLSLALVKRCAELPTRRQTGAPYAAPRRGYTSDDRPILVAFGVASAFAASVVLALFVASTTAEDAYESPRLLWALVPLILFWQCRLWFSTERGHMLDDPIVYASLDWVSWAVAASAVAIIAVAASFAIL